MERIVEQAFLYDFYGELLTEHQRRIYGDFILDNLSLGEIAENSGISRQGVHDLIRRCDKILEAYEGKLHLLEKFLDTKQKISRIQQLVKESINLNIGLSGIENEEQQQRLQQVDELVESLIEHL